MAAVSAFGKAETFHLMFEDAYSELVQTGGLNEVTRWPRSKQAPSSPEPQGELRPGDVVNDDLDDKPAEGERMRRSLAIPSL